VYTVVVNGETCLANLCAREKSLANPPSTVTLTLQKA